MQLVTGLNVELIENQYPAYNSTDKGPVFVLHFRRPPPSFRRQREQERTTTVNFTLVRKTVVPCMLGLSFCAASVSAQNSRAFYISFKVEGSLQTSPTAINNLSTVTGTYKDAKGVHGFVREAFGNITSFDVPGSAATNPTAINDDGMIVGTYTDSSQVNHGFLRHPRGNITRIDVTGSTGTELSGINAFGVITGSAFTSDGSECFVRFPQGTITVFGPSHCVTAGINLLGAITGIAGPSYTGGPLHPSWSRALCVLPRECSPCLWPRGPRKTGLILNTSTRSAVSRAPSRTIGMWHRISLSLRRATSSRLLLREPMMHI